MGALQARHVAVTAMNNRSSRSHWISTFTFYQIEGDPKNPESTRKSHINLVDLAGSERQKKSQTSTDRLHEAGSINMSLTALAKCIHDVAASAAFVSFRSSTLTHLLQESLVGNSKTVMMAAVSPAICNTEESLSTLRFAQS